MAEIPRRQYRLLTLHGLVTHVCDGDTADVEVKFGWFGERKEKFRIRFAGMNTPETGKAARGNFPGQTEEPYAEEAKQYVTDQILGKRIKLVVAQMKGSGNYIQGTRGRVVGVIYLKTWFRPSLNVDLVEKGLARLFPRSSCSWMTNDLWRQLTAAERRAKRKKIKIWSIQQHKVQQSPVWPLLAGLGLGVAACLALYLMFVS